MLRIKPTLLCASNMLMQFEKRARRAASPKGLACLLSTILFTMVAILPCSAQAVEPMPAGRELDSLAPILDEVGVLSPDETVELRRKMVDIDAREGVRVGIVVVDTSAPEGIESLANDLGNGWKIGPRPGTLIVVATQDRAVRIEVSRDLEARLPDLLTQRIIQRSLVPALREGRYQRGFSAALDEIDATLSAGAAHERPAEPEPPQIAPVNRPRLPVLSIVLFQVMFPGFGLMFCLIAGTPEARSLRRWWAVFYLPIIGGAEWFFAILMGWGDFYAAVAGGVSGVAAAIFVYAWAVRCEPELAAAAAKFEAASAEFEASLKRQRQRWGTPKPFRGRDRESWSADTGPSSSGGDDSDSGSSSSESPSDDFAGGGSSATW